MDQTEYSAAFLENEREANQYTRRCMVLLAVVVALVWALNLLGIFIVPQGIMAIAAIGSLLLLLLPTLVWRLWQWESEYTKVCNMACCIVAITLLATAMPKHGIVAWAAPVALSCHYYSKRFTYTTLGLSILFMGLSLIAAIYFGEGDPNIHKEGETIAQAYTNVLLYMLLPRGLTLVGICAACATLADRTHRLLEKQVKDSKEKQRIASELDVATHIQTSMLPCLFPAFPEHREFDIFASMQPAREVGGDFYDFFLVDEKNLAVVMADVSDKGVPAALFMVIGKTLIKDHTAPGEDLGAVFTRVNKLLCESNSEGLFITAFEGVLNLETGEFRYVNAGHEMPFLYRAGEAFRAEPIPPGFVLAGMEAMQYRSGVMTLSRGDKIFLYTDGITEATDKKKEPFGMERLSRSLNAVKDAPPREIVEAVHADINGFAGEAPQFDDITMLCLSYKEKYGEKTK